MDGACNELFICIQIGLLEEDKYLCVYCGIMVMVFSICLIDKGQEKSYNLSIKNKGTEILRIKWRNSVYMEGGESFNTIFDDVFRTIAQ